MTAVEKIVVVGASGLVGAKVVDILRANGLEVLAASRRTGIDVLTGDGFADALRDAQVVVDVTDSPSYEDSALMDFFTTAADNLVSAERSAGVAHHVALSVVGADRMPDSGYMRAKSPRKAGSPAPAFRTPSCGPRNSSNSRVASPMPAPTATPCGGPTR
jgi:uncharacterized protein YbjT (DUF2867 family)